MKKAKFFRYGLAVAACTIVVCYKISATYAGMAAQQMQQQLDVPIKTLPAYPGIPGQTFDIPESWKYDPEEMPKWIAYCQGKIPAGTQLNPIRRANGNAECQRLFGIIEPTGKSDRRNTQKEAEDIAKKKAVEKTEDDNKKVNEEHKKALGENGPINPCDLYENGQCPSIELSLGKDKFYIPGKDQPLRAPPSAQELKKATYPETLGKLKQTKIMAQNVHRTGFVANDDVRNLVDAKEALFKEIPRLVKLLDSHKKALEAMAKEVAEAPPLGSDPGDGSTSNTGGGGGSGGSGSTANPANLPSNGHPTVWDGFSSDPGTAEGQRIINVARANLGANAGISEQCANTVRLVYTRAGYNLRQSTHQLDAGTGGNEAGNLGTGFASSFGPDMGCYITKTSDLRPGDIVLFTGTYGSWGPGAITHVGIYSGNGQIMHHGSSAGLHSGQLTDFQYSKYGTNGWAGAIRPPELMAPGEKCPDGTDPTMLASQTGEGARGTSSGTETASSEAGGAGGSGDVNNDRTLRKQLALLSVFRNDRMLTKVKKSHIYSLWLGSEFNTGVRTLGINPTALASAASATGDIDIAMPKVTPISAGSKGSGEASIQDTFKNLEQMEQLNNVLNNLQNELKNLNFIESVADQILEQKETIAKQLADDQANYDQSIQNWNNINNTGKAKLARIYKEPFAAYIDLATMADDIDTTEYEDSSSDGGMPKRLRAAQNAADEVILRRTIPNVLIKGQHYPRELTPDYADLVAAIKAGIYPPKPGTFPQSFDLMTCTQTAMGGGTSIGTKPPSGFGGQPGVPPGFGTTPPTGTGTMPPNVRDPKEYQRLVDLCQKIKKWEALEKEFLVAMKGVPDKTSPANGGIHKDIYDTLEIGKLAFFNVKLLIITGRTLSLLEDHEVKMEDHIVMTTGEEVDLSDKADMNTLYNQKLTDNYTDIKNAYILLDQKNSKDVRLGTEFPELREKAEQLTVVYNNLQEVIQKNTLDSPYKTMIRTQFINCAGKADCATNSNTAPSEIFEKPLIKVEPIKDSTKGGVHILPVDESSGGGRKAPGDIMNILPFGGPKEDLKFKGGSQQQNGSPKNQDEPCNSLSCAVKSFFK